MTTVAIRVDATPEIGFGHLERMIELGAALAEENHRPVFVTRAKSTGLDRMKARGIERIVEVPEKADLAGETDAILSAGPGFVVLDIGHTSHELAAALKTPGCYLVSFEDLGEGRYLADIVVDANLTEASNPRKIVTPTRFLLGPAYAAVSRACRAARKRRRKFGPLKSVLVSAGGSDPAGVTAGVVAGLSPLSTEIDVEIILGPAFAGQKALDKALLGAARTFSIAEAPDDFAERLRAADLGILSGGVTLFEAAHLGLPAIVIAQNAAQLRNLPPFEAAGGIVSHGLAANKPYGNLVAAIRELGVESKRRAMAASLEEFVDGEGISRIVVAIREMLGR
jgi:spore coat polysaccharide biosynthesis predicted glycosyltransferase SpsG